MKQEQKFSNLLTQEHHILLQIQNKMFFISVAIFAGVYALHYVKVKYFLSDWPPLSCPYSNFQKQCLPVLHENILKHRLCSK